jgi:hypothetical protein
MQHASLAPLVPPAGTVTACPIGTTGCDYPNGRPDINPTKWDVDDHVTDRQQTGLPRSSRIKEW